MARKPKPDAITLAKTNRFNRNALASNRQGRLTSNQILRFSLRLASMLLSVIVTLAFGTACIVLTAVAMPTEALTDHWASLIFAMLLALFGLFWIFDGTNHLWQQALPLLRDVVSGEVAMAEGAVSRDYDDNSYASLWHGLLTWVFHFTAGDHAKHIMWFSGTHYYVLDGQQFTVSQKGYAALTQESLWRLYYASPSKRLVNIEPVASNTNL